MHRAGKWNTSQVCVIPADAGAAFFGVPLAFGLAYFFTDRIKQSWPMCTGQNAGSVFGGLLALAAMLVGGVWRRHRRVAKERLDQEPAEGRSRTP